jgi:hypothetical protein
MNRIIRAIQPPATSRFEHAAERAAGESPLSRMPVIVEDGKYLTLIVSISHYDVSWSVTLMR